MLKLTIYCLSLLGTNIYTNCQHFCLRSLKGLEEASPPPPCHPCWCGCWWRWRRRTSRWWRSPSPGSPLPWCGCWWRRWSRWWHCPSRAGSPSPPPPLSLGFPSLPLAFHFDSWDAWANQAEGWSKNVLAYQTEYLRMHPQKFSLINQKPTFGKWPS